MDMVNLSLLIPKELYNLTNGILEESAFTSNILQEEIHEKFFKKFFPA